MTPKKENAAYRADVLFFSYPLSDFLKRKIIRPTPTISLAVVISIVLETTRPGFLESILFRSALREKGFTDREMSEADLIRPGSRGGFYSTFRNRLVFPVIDVRGNVTGFSGRIIGDGEPKYLNTKDTPVFTKGRLLFGLNLARKSKSDYMILVEGNVDVVSLHQAGFDSAVASLGTSLTKEQAQPSVPLTFLKSLM